MSFTILQKNLLELLEITCPVAPTKSSLQVLSNIKISCTEKNIEITATDLDHSIRGSGSIDGDSSFEIAVNARKIYDIVKEIPQGNVVVEVDESVLSLQSEKGFLCKIAGTDVQDFPAFPEEKQTGQFDISYAAFKDMAKKSSFAVSKDTSRSCLSGVLWENSGKKSTMVATDGHRLGATSITVEQKSKEKIGGIITPKTLLHIDKILPSSADKTMTVSFGEKYCTFTTEQFSLCSKLIEGPYPDYEKVIPKNNPKKLMIEKALLSNAVRRVSVLSNQKTHLIKCVFSDKSLEIVVLNREIGAEARETIPVDYTGDTHTVGFNGMYLMEILSIIDTATVRLEMNTQISACLLFPEYGKDAANKSEDLFLIMPLRIMDEL